MADYSHDPASDMHIDWSAAENLPYVEQGFASMMDMQSTQYTAGVQESQQELRPSFARASTYYDPLRDAYVELPAPGTGVSATVSTTVEKNPYTTKGSRWTEEELRILRESREAGLTHARISEMLPGRTPRAIQVKWGLEKKKRGNRTPAGPTPRELGDGFSGLSPRYKRPWTPEQNEKLLRTWWEKGTLDDLKSDPGMPSRDMNCLKSRRNHLAKIRSEVYIRVMKDYANVSKNSPALIPLSK
jgi:hypothetical protein